MTTVKELVERLRGYDGDPGKTAWEAANTLTQQEAEIVALREALQVIADGPGPASLYFKGVGDVLYSENDHMAMIARAALSPTTATDPEPSHDQ